MSIKKKIREAMQGNMEMYDEELQMQLFVDNF